MSCITAFLAKLRWLSTQFRGFLGNQWGLIQHVHIITVVVDAVSSFFHNINAGVPQGSVLAPTLLLLQINDLLCSSTNPIHSYADETTLHAGIMSNRAISMVKLERGGEATTASLSKDLGNIIAARKYHSPSNLLMLYKAQIRPSLEYCSHIWGVAAPITLSILDAV
nr:unnamed protein product [Callosobruchus chinensis]